jgi:hypothetical protein
VKKRALWQLLTLNGLLLLAQLAMTPTQAKAEQEVAQCCQKDTENHAFCCVCGSYACGPTEPSCTASSQCR